MKRILSVIVLVFLVVGLFGNVNAQTSNFDIAYVVKTSGNSNLTQLFTDNDWSYKIIKESELSGTDWSKYKAIVVNTDEFVDSSKIPINQKPSVVISSRNHNSDNIEDWKWTSAIGGINNPSQPQTLLLWGTGNPMPHLSNTLRTYDFLSASSAVYEIDYVTGANKAGGMQYVYVDGIISGPQPNNGGVIMGIDKNGLLKDNSRTLERGVFFGIPRIDLWSSETETVFLESLDWVTEGLDDLDGDGHVVGDDCDDNDATKYQMLSGFVDNDGDGYGIGNAVQICTGDSLPIGYASVGGDCNDNDAAKYQTLSGFVDNDRDGYGIGSAVQICTGASLPSGYASVGGDCNDNDATVNPGATDPLKKCVNFAPVFNGPIADITWAENGAGKNLNLANYFTDQNGNILTYGVADSSNSVGINFIIDEDSGLVEFSSDTGFFGNDWVVFYADDGVVKTNTNQINLIVTEIDTSTPVVSLVSPAEATEFNASREVAFEFSVTDDTSSLECKLMLDSGNGFLVKSTKTVSTNGIFNETLEDGNYKWKVACSDGVNEGQSGERTFLVNAPDVPVFVGLTNKSINENQLLTFSVLAVDNDAGNVLNYSVENLPLGATFEVNTKLFSWKPAFEQSGSYIVTFIVEDSDGNEERKNITIIVNDVKESPKFSDLDLCDVNSNDLSINIKEPDDGDDFTVGDNIKGELEIRNLGNEDLDLDVEVHLYDLDEDESVEDFKDNLNVDSGDEENFDFDFEIPNNVEDSDFALLVIAEDTDVCRYEFIEIELEREDDLLEIKDVSVGSEAYLGERVDFNIEVVNIGGDDQDDVYVELKNAELGVAVQSEKFDLEKYGDDDENKITLSAFIPEDAEEKDYEFEIRIFYNGEEEFVVKTVSVSERGNVLVASSDDEEEEVPEIVERGIVQKLFPVGNQGVKKPAFSEEQETWPFVLLIVILLIGIGVIVYAIQRVREGALYHRRKEYVARLEKEKAALESAEAMIEMNLEKKDTSKKKTVKKKAGR